MVRREDQGPAEGLDPLLDPGEAQTEGDLGIHPFAVILDLDLDDPIRSHGGRVDWRDRDPHRGTTGTGMAGHVGQAFLDDPVDRDAQGIIENIPQSERLDRPIRMALAGSPGLDQIA